MLTDLDGVSKVVTLLLSGAAALISWLNYRKSGTQKVAQFRKEWIENLRIHLAEFNAVVFRMAWCRKKIETAKRRGDTREFLNLIDKLAENKDRASYLQAYIRLMLNEDEYEHADLQRSLARMAQSPLKITKDARESHMRLCRSILKTEWHKAKSEM